MGQNSVRLTVLGIGLDDKVTHVHLISLRAGGCWEGEMVPTETVPLPCRLPAWRPLYSSPSLCWIPKSKSASSIETELTQQFINYVPREGKEEKADKMFIQS